MALRAELHVEGRRANGGGEPANRGAGLGRALGRSSTWSSSKVFARLSPDGGKMPRRFFHSALQVDEWERKRRKTNRNKSALSINGFRSP